MSAARSIPFSSTDRFELAARQLPAPDRREDVADKLSRHHKWRALALICRANSGAISLAKGSTTLAESTAAMERAGRPEAKIRKVLGLNRLRLLDEVWNVAR